MNLLPQNEKKNIRRNYVMRRAIVLLCFVLLASITVFVFLIPSYLLSKSKEEDLVQIVEKLGSKAESADRVALNIAVADANEKIKILRGPMSGKSVSELVSEISQSKTADIKLTGFRYSQTETPEKPESPSEITLSGIARNRESLKSFEKILNGLDGFSKVELPVSSFAKDKNIDFSFKITGNF